LGGEVVESQNNVLRQTESDKRTNIGCLSRKALGLIEKTKNSQGSEKIKKSEKKKIDSKKTARHSKRKKMWKKYISQEKMRKPKKEDLVWPRQQTWEQKKKTKKKKNGHRGKKKGKKHKKKTQRCVGGVLACPGATTKKPNPQNKLEAANTIGKNSASLDAEPSTA